MYIHCTSPEWILTSTRQQKEMSVAIYVYTCTCIVDLLTSCFDIELLFLGTFGSVLAETWGLSVLTYVYIAYTVWTRASQTRICLTERHRTCVIIIHNINIQTSNFYLTPTKSICRPLRKPMYKPSHHLQGVPNSKDLFVLTRVWTTSTFPVIKWTL